MSTRILTKIVAFLFVAVGMTRAQAILSVPSTSYPTIQSAINAAAINDTIIVAPGTYFENLVLTGPAMQIFGSGAGQSIIDGGNTASCLKVLGDPSAPDYLVEGFTLQNGKGEYVNSVATNTRGGGILSQPSSGYSTTTIKDCEIVNCAADTGSAVSLFNTASTRLEGVEIHACSSAVNLSGDTSSVVDTYGGLVRLTMTNCHVHNNSVQGSVIYSENQLTMADCLFESNTTFGGILHAVGLWQSVRRSCFTNNLMTNPTGGAVCQITGNYADCVDCLFANNVGGVGVMGFITINPAVIANITIASNRLSNPAVCVLFLEPSQGIANLISWDNTDAAMSAVPPILTTTGGPYVGTLQNSLIQNGAALGVTLLSDPQFVDPINGDFRLLPGSPAIDAGTSAIATNVNVPPPIVSNYPTFSTEDVEGNPRVRGMNVDLGCYESQTIASSPASAGRVGMNAGGPFDVLMINGSAGGTERTVQVPLGTSSVMTMQQPPNLAGPAQFSVFGLLGRAELEYVYPVPLGIGDMCFAPAPLFPTLQSFLFTYASTVGPINSVLPFLPAYPTPWSSGQGPAIPFPLTLSFQGVIEEAPGVFVATNLILLEVN